MSLASHNGGILIQELLRPSEVKPFEGIAFEYNTTYDDIVKALVSSTMEAFSPEQFNSEVVANLRALVASISGNGALATITPITAAQGSQSSNALMAALQASVAVAEAAKSA